MKRSPNPLLALLAICLILPSCDSLKEKALAILDEKIEEAGGEQVASDDGSGDPAAGPQQAVRDLSADDYDSFIAGQGRVILVSFVTDSCPHCLKLMPVLEGIANGNDRVLLGKVDKNKHHGLANRENAQGVPDVRIFVNGNQVDGFVGAPPEAVVKGRINSQLEKLSAAPPAPKPAPVPKPKPKPQPKPEPKADDGSKNQGDEPEKDPTIKKMDKDWLPPGIQRK